MVANAPNPAVIGLCPTCSAKLPLRRRHADEPVFIWRCVRCETRAKGCLLQHVVQEVRGNVRLEGFQIDENQFPTTSGGLYLVSIAGRDERRDSPRRRSGAVVPAVPLDAQSFPCGDVFLVVVRDISASGVGLTHPDPIESPQLALQLSMPSGDKVQVIGAVTRCHARDNAFDIGLRLVRRLEG